jgi:hypothetical protein
MGVLVMAGRCAGGEATDGNRMWSAPTVGCEWGRDNGHDYSCETDAETACHWRRAPLILLKIVQATVSVTLLVP